MTEVWRTCCHADQSLVDLSRLLQVFAGRLERREQPKLSYWLVVMWVKSCSGQKSLPLKRSNSTGSPSSRLGKPLMRDWIPLLCTKTSSLVSFLQHKNQWDRVKMADWMFGCSDWAISNTNQSTNLVMNPKPFLKLYHLTVPEIRSELRD